MSSSQPGNIVDNLGIDIEKLVDGDTLSSSLLHLEMSTGTIISHKSPRERNNTSDILSHQSPKTHSNRRDGSARSTTRSPISRPSSSIPLPVKSPKSIPQKASLPVVRTSSRLTRSSSATLKGLSQITNKHTLEIQFINKKKRLCLLKKELSEKQKPVLDLYQNLLQIKKRLEELGKIVYLEEVKLMSYNENAENVPESGGDAGESISPEVLLGMQTSIEEIPKTLMEICKNLLGRRNVIVELLESIVKSEVDVVDLRDQIETLKLEGTQLQNNLDVVIIEHHEKIKEIVHNWQVLLNDKTNVNTSGKVEELQEHLKLQNRLVEESKAVIQELQKKLDDKRGGHDRYVAELNNVIHSLKEQIQKLEQDVENEKKATTDYRNRNNANAQNSKVLRNKIADLENEKKASEVLNNDLSKKLRLLQDQFKHKEGQWTKEKEELSKSLKHQENMLQKLTADKNSFETRLEAAEGERSSLEETLQNNINNLNEEVGQLRNELKEMSVEKREAIEKCREMEEHIASIGLVNKETMNLVSSGIDWGKDIPVTLAEGQMYSQSMMKDIMLREYEDKIKRLEEENREHLRTLAVAETTKAPTETEKALLIQHDLVKKYKQLLAESEQKLTEKSQEVSKLTAEIRQLKVRQEHLEELNVKCPTENLQKIVEDDRDKLKELMKRSLESEHKILHCESIIEKQSKQMNELENLLRYRENMAGVLKASRDELILEKESLTRYSHEMRTVLAEVTKEDKMKDRLIKELQEKIDLRERQINKLEKEVRELETNLMMTNEKRFKLQETVGSMEKELQTTKAHVNQLADINTRYEIGMKCPNTCTSDKLQLFSIPKCSNSADNVQKSINKKKSSCQAFSKNIIFTNVTDARDDLFVDTNKQVISNIKLGSRCGPSKDFEGWCHPKLNSKSLIGLSLKQVDFLRSRLNYLTQVNISAIKSVEAITKPSKGFSSRAVKVSNDSTNNLNKIVELTAKRYDFLQKQAYDSYEELTNLVKLAISSRKVCENEK